MRKKMDTEQLLDKLTQAVSFKYKEDKTAPSVIVSKLKTGYYCSVVRYNGSFAKEKQLICSARGESLPKTLTDLASTFISVTDRPKDPIQELASLIGV